MKFGDVLGVFFSPPNFQQSLRTPQNTPSPLILRPPTHCIALNKRQKESEELVRKSPKKQKLISNTKKLSADELLKKYRNHFKKDEDIEMENAADALDIKNEAVQVTHQSFKALMQATGGFRPGEFTIVGS